MAASASRVTAYLVLGLSGLLGGGSLLLFVWFLYAGSLNLVRLGLGETAALFLDAGLSLAFFLQHSLMIRRSFRQRLAHFLPQQYDAALFSIAAGVVLLGVLVFWQETAPALVAPSSPARGVLRAVFFLSAAGFGWGILALGAFDPFGFGSIRNHLRGTQASTAPVVVRGPYRWVRHPLYFFLLLMMWFYPDLTADRLLFDVLWTAWVIVGARLEERDLVSVYGDAYRDYQRRVPMLVPWRGRASG